MKRFQLPLHKGTEPFPQTTIQPTKLVIAGIDTGTPLYRAVAERFGGQLKAFHGRMQQNYSLSINEQMKVRQSVPGARMSYQNNQGQETLHLEVDHKVLKKIEEKIPPVLVPWDWAVIDFETKLATHSYTDGNVYAPETKFYAKMVAPHPNTSLPKADPSGEYAAAGDNIAYHQSAEIRPIVRWAGYAPDPQVGATVTEGSTTETNSLLIDMRNFHTYEEMVFEIYGNVEEMDDDYNLIKLASTYYGYIQLASTPADLEDALHNPTAATLTGATGTDYYDDAAVPTDLPTHSLGEAWPPFAFGGRVDLLTGLLVDISTAFNVPIPQGAQLSDGFHENVLHYSFANEYQYDSVPFPVSADTTTDLKYVVFRGEPGWAWSEHIESTTQIYSERWESTKMYPTRFGTGRLVDGVPLVASTLSDLGPENNHGLTYLGRLSVLPKRGGAAFKRA